MSDADLSLLAIAISVVSIILSTIVMWRNR